MRSVVLGRMTVALSQMDTVCFRWRQYVAEWRTESGRHTSRVPCADLVALLPPYVGHAREGAIKLLPCGGKSNQVGTAPHGALLNSEGGQHGPTRKQTL